MFQVRTDQRAALETFVASEILSDPPQETYTIAGAWLDRRLRGGKTRQIAGWDPSELEEHDSPLQFVGILLEVIDGPGTYQLRVEWRDTDPETGKQNTQTDLYKRKKNFAVKREQVAKTDRTNDPGAALRGMGAALAQNADRAMDGQQRFADSSAKVQADFMDRMLLMQERHLVRMDEEQANVVDLMDERAELIAEVKLGELKLELERISGQQNLIAQSITAAVTVLQPVIEVVTRRLTAPAGGAPQALPLEGDRMRELEATVAAQAALIGQLQADPAASMGGGPA